MLSLCPSARACSRGSEFVRICEHACVRECMRTCVHAAVLPAHCSALSCYIQGNSATGSLETRMSVQQQDSISFIHTYSCVILEAS